MSQLIKEFINENKTNFILNISNDKKEEISKLCLWHLEHNERLDEDVLLASLECLRILSRDISMEPYLCSINSWELYFNVVGIAHYAEQTDSAVSLIKQNPTIVVECLKAMCNMTKNFYSTIPSHLYTVGARGILRRIQLYDQQVPEITNDLKIFEMKLLFLLTALGPGVRLIVVQDCDGIHHLTSIIESHARNIHGITNELLILDCEILKVLFNILYQTFPAELEKKVETDMKRLVNNLKDLLIVLFELESVSTTIKIEFTNNVSNLLTSLPDKCFRYLLFDEYEIPEDELYKSSESMKCVQLLINHLELRLNENINLTETLAPMLHGLSKGCRADRNFRKYCRLKVLPYMKSEVLMLPEQGSTTRNKCCCSFERAIKYTGFGNFAGFLARHALLGGANRDDDSGISYSESEESDTDEYVKLRDKINPVTGKVEEEKSNPLEGMSDEQKEYEVVQLMKTIDLLQKGGLISPGIIGDDGNVRPAESVLELVSKATAAERHDESDNSD